MIPPNLSNFYISKYVSRSSRSFGNWKETCPIPVYMTGALEMTCVFDRHYGLKTHFPPKKLLFERFIGQKVRFQTIVPVKKTCHLRVWGKSPFDFQNFEKILRHILKYRNCSNLEGSLLNTIWSCGEKTLIFLRLIRLVGNLHSFNHIDNLRHLGYWNRFTHVGYS